MKISTVGRISKVFKKKKKDKAKPDEKHEDREEEEHEVEEEEGAEESPSQTVEQPKEDKQSAPAPVAPKEEKKPKVEESTTPKKPDMEQKKDEKKEPTRKESTDKPKSVPDPPVIPTRLIRVEATSGEKSVKGTRSNHYLFFNNCKDCSVVVPSNQKAHKIVIANCSNATFQVHDSCVISTQAVELVNLNNCNILFDEVDVRSINCFNVNKCVLQFTNEPTLIDNLVITWYPGCKSNDVQRVIIKKGTDPNKQVVLPTELINNTNCHYTVNTEQIEVKVKDPKKLAFVSTLPDGIKLTTSARIIDKIRTADDVLKEVTETEKNNSIIDAMPRDKLGALYDDELKEFTDPPEELQKKVKFVADAIKNAKHCVVYTGAGISTAAKIPDYRGPQGVWTSRDKGIMPEGMELSKAVPTYAHYAITDLYKRGLVKYVVSTNLDGLHRRTGLPENGISELHGNCYREVCADCGKEYLRGFDTLTTRTDRWTHLTGRNCECGGPLKDTIIHFTENMPEKEMNLAMEHARKADLALVLGTSMNVQPAASLCDKALKNPNGKRTPYDKTATLKVYARTDEFMQLLMKQLEITEIDTQFDLMDELIAEERKKQAQESTAYFKPYMFGLAAVLGIAGAALAYQKRM